jgi:hypothetical protein
LATHALEVLGVEEEEEPEGYKKEERGKPSMFRIDGTKIPNSPINNQPWNVSRYLTSLRKSAGQLKLGVGFSGSMNVRSVTRTPESRSLRYSPSSKSAPVSSSPLCESSE